jgi:hypothetical protein
MQQIISHEFESYFPKIIKEFDKLPSKSFLIKRLEILINNSEEL